MALPLDSLPGSVLEPFTKDVAAVAATSTFSVMACLTSAGQRFRVIRAHLLVDATYAADASNYYAITLVHNGTTIATWSTQTAAQGALTAFVAGEMILAADTGSNLVVLPGETMTLVCTKNGSAANLTARAVVHGRWVS